MADDGELITEERLVAFAAGELSDRDAEDMERRLRTSPQLVAVVSRLRQIIETLRVDDSVAPDPQVIRRARSAIARARRRVLSEWLEHARRVVAELVFDCRTQPMLAGYRGESSAFQMAWDSDLAWIDVRVSPPPAEAGLWKVIGRVRARGSHIPGQVLLLAHGTDDSIGETAVDAHGRFQIESLPGRYDLAMQFGDDLLLAPELDLE